MAMALHTRHVLPVLAERGVKVHRERLAEISDLLGLQTRPSIGNHVQRTWLPAEVELIAVAFELHRFWRLQEDDIRALVGDDGSYAATLVGKLREVLAEFRGSLEAAREAQRKALEEADEEEVSPAVLPRPDAALAEVLEEFRRRLDGARRQDRYREDRCPSAETSAPERAEAAA